MLTRNTQCVIICNIRKRIQKRVKYGSSIYRKSFYRIICKRFCTYFPYKNEDKSLCQICEEEEKSKELVRNRLKYGYSLDDALNKPKKISKQGKPIVVYGVLYNSIAMACRKLDLKDKENTIRSRLRAGKTVDEAFRF